MEQYVVIAFPPLKGFWADLKPRPQMWNTVEPVLYDSKEEAIKQQEICQADTHRVWNYKVFSISEWEKFKSELM